ncbi:TraB/TrbI/VirB10 family type IV secretion system protein [Sphingomonas immobilis]|uniref:TrbI/VirB10 family protein n=1 Tax=Sphingomonas immobilis TaxID=3063997 RepID=A0ABT9A125_9SPHN|nr:TrbI/VirB10 family protein [Sphingomonas sp. CA1-15]MDO7843539.1 TrbI/VirB10 family protein [Sphingomonas sp. CA1-15]
MSETMPDVAREAAPIAPPKVDPETLVLRARPTRAIRFKRGVIAALGGTAAVAIVATAWFALEPHALHLVTESDDKSIAAKPPSDTLSALPTGYGAVPKLGPPLPGDLGRPILDRQHQLATEMAPNTVPSNGQNVAVQNAAEERQRALTELKAARQSGLLVQNSNGGGQPAAASASIVPSAADEANQVGKVALDPERDPNGQQRKADFLRTTDKASDTNPYAVVTIPSPNTLSAGSVIAASLITGLRSDLPGLVVAQVTERIFDSATGQILLIPQGAKLVGIYDSVVAFGQSRALLVWQRIIFPDGSSLRLDNAPASDPSGYAGVADKVDFHTWSLLKGVVLSTLLGVGSELQFSGESDLVQAVRQSTQQNVSRAGDQITSRNLQVQPTITIRPGAPIRLLVHHDLILKPWVRRDD